MKNLLAILLLTITLSGAAQNFGSVKGSVNDASTCEPLPGVHVWVEQMGKIIGSVTDPEGNFYLNPLSPGQYVVHFSILSYQKLSLTAVNVKPDQITFLHDIGLVHETYTGDIVEIVAESKNPVINPEEPTRIVALAGDIEKLPVNKDPVAILASLSTNIKTTEDGEIYFRGSRSGAGVYYVDGIRVSTLEHIVPGQAIGSFTVYSGGIPARYGDTTGGVVVIETQSYFDLYNRWQAALLLQGD